MNQIRSHLEAVQIIAKLADLKEDHYQTSLLLHAVANLLIEKRVFTREELSARMAGIDGALMPNPYPDHPIM